MQRTRTRSTWVGGTTTLTTNGGGKYGPIRRQETNLCVDVTNHGPPYKSGGPLDISKRNFHIGVSESNSLSGNFGYKGAFFLEPPSPTLAIPSGQDLTGWGAKGYSRALPVHNELNLAQSFGELKDFPDMLRTSQNFLKSYLKAHRGAGIKFWSEQYLNGQFGWKPFADDVFKALSMQRRLQNRMNWLRNHNGKNIKRSFTLSSGGSNSLISSSEGIGVLQPFLNTFCYPLGPNLAKGRVETWRSINYNIWFSGCFTFYIPPSELMPNGNQHGFLENKLSGAIPDLETFYKLTPWTWLIDWFSSAGSIVSNFMLMAKYHQVARYAYVMEEQTTTVRSYGYQFVNTGYHGAPVPALVSASSATTVERKQRAVANPYGFGITWDGLNPYQLSILAALGVTRGKGSR
jgi:hypothetical protein